MSPQTTLRYSPVTTQATSGIRKMATASVTWRHIASLHLARFQRVLLRRKAAGRLGGSPMSTLVRGKHLRSQRLELFVEGGMPNFALRKRISEKDLSSILSSSWGFWFKAESPKTCCDSEEIKVGAFQWWSSSFLVLAMLASCSSKPLIPTA